jgi:ribosomal protein L11 methylase PrmA
LDIQLLLTKALRTLRQDGLRGTVRRMLTQVKNDPSVDAFDLTYGTNTGGIEPLWKFNICSPNARFGTRYEATTEQELTSAVGFLQEDPNKFTFIDLGCGKGITLIVAAMLGFKKVIGVEFAPELVEVAKKNLTKMHISNAVVLNSDAADFSFPQGDTVVYLYNPFSEKVMRQVVTNLGQACSNKLYLIYKNPQCADIFEASGFLKRFGCPPAAPHMHIWSAHKPN